MVRMPALPQKLRCRYGYHVRFMQTAVVQGNALRYSAVTPGAVIARYACRDCEWTEDVEYETRIILQKPKAVMENAR